MYFHGTEKDFRKAEMHAILSEAARRVEVKEGRRADVIAEVLEHARTIAPIGEQDELAALIKELELMLKEVS